VFKDVKELKSFIMWARSKKLSRIKVDNIEVEISNYAFAEDIEIALSKPSQTPIKETSETKQDTEEDPDLFWSSNQ
jgi:hypothetical protein